MVNLSQAIRKFNRFELKYLLPLRAAQEFKHSLRAYLVPDEMGDKAGSYYLSSLYYDSPDHRCYWEKIDGARFRRKLRIRRYESEAPLTEDSPVFVEIKQRLDRVTQKRRVLLPYGQASRLCNNRERPEPGQFDPGPQDARVLDEVLTMLWQYNLRPASLLRYARQALIGTDYDIGLRVTFDTDLTYRVTDLELSADSGGLPLFPADWVVVEIKVNERVPYWLTEMVAQHNLSLARMSKYCRSIELADLGLAPQQWRYGVGV
jgi:hypothetical protein